MEITILDYIVFFVFVGGVALFGCSFYFRTRNDAAAFTAAKGSLPAWVVGMSIFATFVSSISFLGLPGDAYKGNWNPFVFSLSIPVATYLAAKVFIPLYRSINSVSAYHYLEQRFGYWARCYVAICYLLTQLARVGSILLLLALPLNTMFGWDISTIIIWTGIVTLVYSLLGGIAAVVWTDAVQGIILIVGAVACAAILTFTMPEGPGQLFEIASEHGKFSLGSFGASLTEPTFWVVLIYGLFVNMQNYGIDQNYVQRYMTTKSLGEAVKSTLFGGLLYIPVSLVFVYIGTALFSYYTAQPDLLPAGTPADQVFPYFIVHGLPTGLTGLVIASLFSAGMSTIATSINSSATIVLTDFVRRLSQKELTEKKKMAVLYATSFVVGALGIVVGLLMMSIDGVLDAHGEADEVGTHAGLEQLFVRELPVRVAGRVQHAGAGIGHVGDDSRQSQCVHEADGGFASALQAEGDYPARAVGQVLLRQGMVAVAWQVTVVDPGHLVVPRQVFGHGQGVGTVPGHTQVECFQPEVEQEGVLRRALPRSRISWAVALVM